jgi:natural resistance-associated macrophage protein
MFFAFSIFVMGISFFINMFKAEPNVHDMVSGAFLPSVPKDSSDAALGLVGSVIMPHNLFLHSALVLTRSIDMNSN